MKRKISVLLLILIVLFTFGCGAQSKSESAQDASKESGMAASPQSEQLSTNLSLDSVEKKIIKNADVNITVKNNQEAEGKVQEMVVKYQGFIQNTESNKNKDHSYTNMDVRIPAERFESFLSEIKDVGEITHDRVYTTDVTEEYIDLSARQRTLLVQEGRLQEMLKQTKNVEELLKVENELSRIRGEIERITGRLKYLDNKTSYSTVKITLSTKYIAGDSGVNGFGAEVLHSLQSGFNAFLTFILLLIRICVFLLPFLVIIVPVGYLVYKKKGNIFFRK